MPADLDYSETREHVVRMKAAHGGVGAKGARVVRAFTHRVEARAKVYCPVDTGLLRNSIESSFEGDGRTGEMVGAVTAGGGGVSHVLYSLFGDGINYARYVEYGTSRMAAQPFMTPAFDEEIPGYEAACAALAAECAA